MTIIETTGLTKRYGRLRAVDQATFRVERGQVFGFLGPNGSGKTTTIGMLLDIIRPTAGHVRLFDDYEGRTLHHARRRIGATLETANFYPYLSGYDNLRVAARIKGADGAAIERALAAVGLSERARDQFRKYSLGMKQRLAIGAAMLGDPELVILDEPMNGLDPEGMREIRDVLHRLRDEGRTLFVSSHLLYEIERTCTHVAIIKKGRILRSGPLSDLMSAHAIAFARAHDLQALLDTARAYAGTVSAVVEGDGVLIELREPDTALLNRWLAERNVFLSHLSLRQQSLEDVFLELTAEQPTAVEAVA